MKTKKTDFVKLLHLREKSFDLVHKSSDFSKETKDLIYKAYVLLREAMDQDIKDGTERLEKLIAESEKKSQ